MKKTVVFLADGFEECEALVTVDLLRRAGTEVITASVMGRRQITAGHQVVVTADAMAEDVDFTDVDMIVLPGGGLGTKNLTESPLVAEQCMAFAKEKLIGAICAAPGVLGGLGLLEGKRATCYPGCEERMKGACATGENATVDGNIITGRAAGCAYDFALELIRALEGDAKAAQIAQEIVYNR